MESTFTEGAIFLLLLANNDIWHFKLKSFHSENKLYTNIQYCQPISD